MAVVGLSLSEARADEKRREELALKVMELTGAADVGGQVAAGLLTQLRPMFPTVPEELWKELAEAFSSQEIIELSIPIYVKHFDEEELAALATFYESPLGTKVIQKMPVVMQESMLIGNEYRQRKATEIIDRLKAEGHEPRAP